jgi:hypothetical protein
MKAARMRTWAAIAAMVLGVGAGWGATGRGVSAARKKAEPKKPAIVAVSPDNPLLPPQVAADALMPELSVLQKMPMVAPAGFEPIYRGDDWAAYREQFGDEADNIGRKKSSGIAEFATRLIAAADAEAAKGKDGRLGLARLLYLRAVGLTYRNRDGFPVANKAVEAYQRVMDVKDPLQVAGLWTMTNQMSKMAVTPKPERIAYSGIAARANMQLALLLLDRDQIDAAEGMMRQIGYHEGWLKGDTKTRRQIAAVRAQVKQTAGLLADLGQKYEPAVRGDDAALMEIYLYGRYVKCKPELVADLPGRKPASAMAQLAGAIASAEKHVDAAFTAAEMLKNVGENMPDGVLKRRTLWAALGYYRTYIKDPSTERERIKRTLSRMAIEAVIGDGAQGPHAIDPMAVTAPATQPATRPAEPETPIAADAH